VTLMVVCVNFYEPCSMRFALVSWTDLALWETEPLRFKGEFALTAIDNDLFRGPRFCGANRRSVGESEDNELATGNPISCRATGIRVAGRPSTSKAYWPPLPKTRSLDYTSDTIVAKENYLKETNQIYSEIVRQIAAGQLSPGQRLVEKKLALLFDTSRTPIREVLFKLERDGLVQRTRNEGARVAAFTPDDIEQIYEIRAALECLAVRNAVKNLTLNSLFDFERRLEELRANTGPDTYKQLYEVDLQLHELIISHSGNPRLASYLERLSLLINSVRLLTQRSEDVLRAAFEEHLVIIRALIARDGELAERLVGEHIQSAKRRALEFFHHTGRKRSSLKVANIKSAAVSINQEAADSQENRSPTKSMPSAKSAHK
jgi:DNA-binding GntR family transcriptional regulator